MDWPHLAFTQKYTLHEKCPYSELFWAAFSRILTEYVETPYSVRMWENADQNTSKYGQIFAGIYWAQKACFFSTTNQPYLLIIADTGWKT